MGVDRTRELAKSELTELPEARLWPPGARVVYSDASGTWEGHGYDWIPLGNWVANTRYQQANGGSPKRWAARLEELLGWRWLSGNDMVLLKNFALREGHTRVPEDHYEEGRPLGLVVRDWREFHRMGGNWRLPPGLEKQLESIDGWEWWLCVDRLAGLNRNRTNSVVRLVSATGYQ